MPSRPILFIDDGGVMNDNAVRGPQWQRLVGEFLAPILGGTPRAWAKANPAVVTDLFAEHARTTAGRTDRDFAAWQHAYRIGWTRGMCERVGVAVPSDDDCYDLARRAAAYVTLRMRSAFPGTVEAVRELHALGYMLHTASGEDTDDLHGYLTGMGVRDCFDRLYGPDLINTPKEGALYYERIFADAGVAPVDALVVDDSPHAASWAIAAGARAVLVTQDRADGPVDACVRSLAELPHLLEQP